MEKEWYVVNTYSGHENKVKEKLEMRSESMDMQDYIFRVVIPEEKVVEVPVIVEEVQEIAPELKETLAQDEKHEEQMEEEIIKEINIIKETIMI